MLSMALCSIVLKHDCIESDFSPESRKMFEKFIGKKLERFPEDIFEWKVDDEGEVYRKEGVYYRQWLGLAGLDHL